MVVKSKVNKLYQLGSVEFSSEWLNYLALGFTEQDVPALLALIENEDLQNADVDSEDVWVPLHAWRALSQIASEQAIIPLMEMYPHLLDDDWALNEMPMVLGSHGPAAIKPLTDCLNDSDCLEQSRAMVTDALPKIAKEHPETRHEILQHLKRYITESKVSDDGLNSLVVCSLVDLDAVELIDDIEQLFENNAVDISFCGDFEEVEMELGLRNERETPKPDYAKLQKAKELSAELSKPDEEDLDALLDFYLSKYANDFSVKNLSELDGYFVALVSSPTMVMPADWLAAMWGGTDHMPEWESAEEFQAFSRAILSIYNFVIRQLDSGSFSAMFHQREVGGKVYYIVDDWCEGYIRGLELAAPNDLDRAYIDEHTPSIQLFSLIDNVDQRLKMDDAEIVKRQDMIEAEAEKIYQHFYALRSQPVVNDVPKVGRNDPCPCGSGKKFKKCCLH